MTRPRLARRSFAAISLLLLAAGCTSSGTARPDAGQRDPGTPVTVRDEIPAELAEELARAEATDGAGLTGAHPIVLSTELGYDPRTAVGLERIQASALPLSEPELEKLASNGFVVSRDQFPTFSYGYKAIYAEHLPLFVSADSLLFAVHRSFDKMLSSLEQNYLSSELEALLDGMRKRLAESAVQEPLRGDLDLYLTLAQSLMRDQSLATVTGGRQKDSQQMFELATAGQGHRVVSWFGSTRDEDFSQFKPRGHYTDNETLRRYFRAMMLLGRVDLRLIETQSDGSQEFHRQQFDAAVALNELLEPDRERWSRIDRIIGAFVGERDSMSPDELGGLLTKLGASTLANTTALTDQELTAEIAQGGWGAQRIASRIIVNAAPDGRTLPLDRSFALFGQRYTVDSHVFVNTTYDRVAGRLMPDPLDVAFGALGNDSALELLGPELGNSSYAAGLAKTRTLVDAHEDAYWDDSLYTTWLSALRTLSPTSDRLSQLPTSFATRAGQNRILNTQLASWAELRHDTILYVKQSYTAGPSCEFPDAYVEPYPELYARLGRFAARVGDVAALLPANDPWNTQQRLASWVDNFQTVMTNLERMAENQQTGTPHAPELLAFINQAVTWDEAMVCGGLIRSNTNGWYVRLFLDENDNYEEDPTIADVHTQPMDAAGNDVGRILHVGTGRPRLMVTTVETCSGPRAYVGLASSYAQFVEADWKRLSDPEWLERIDATRDFPDPPWMMDLLPAR